MQRIPVRLALDPVEGMPQLRAGMSADVEIDTGRERARYSALFGGTASDHPVASR